MLFDYIAMHPNDQSCIPMLLHCPKKLHKNRWRLSFFSNTYLICNIKLSKLLNIIHFKISFQSSYRQFNEPIQINILYRATCNSKLNYSSFTLWQLKNNLYKKMHNKYLVTEYCNYLILLFTPNLTTCYITSLFIKVTLIYTTIKTSEKESKSNQVDKSPVVNYPKNRS